MRQALKQHVQMMEAELMRKRRIATAAGLAASAAGGDKTTTNRRDEDDDRAKRPRSAILQPDQPPSAFSQSARHSPADSNATKMLIT